MKSKTCLKIEDKNIYIIMQFSDCIAMTTRQHFEIQ